MSFLKVSKLGSKCGVENVHRICNRPITGACGIGKNHIHGIRQALQALVERTSKHPRHNRR